MMATEATVRGVLHAAVADYLTAVADHWATVTTIADRTGDQALRVYAAAVEAEADVRAARAQAVADNAPADELATAFRLLAAVTLQRIAASYQAGQPDRPTALAAAEARLSTAATAARRTLRPARSRVVAVRGAA